MALDSKLRGCDLVKLRVADIAYGDKVMPCSHVIQQKAGTPVQFEITKGTRTRSRLDPRGKFYFK